MRSSIRFVLASVLASAVPAAFAQTFTDCNPLKQDCPPNAALGRTITADFTKQSSDFRVGGTGSVTYGPEGATMTVAKSGDSPLLLSNWYMMFGRIEITAKTAGGAGLVSSIVLQSDDLDEIDWEWLGGHPDVVQTNYFGKGIPDYTRSGTHPNPGHNDGFHKYAVEWSASQIVWSIDGEVIRVVSASEAGNQFPQTPMQIRLGPWAGGDPANNGEGTVQWAGGPTDFSKGPFTMVIKSVVAHDYSTGSAYQYTDRSGTWGSIKAIDGSVHGTQKDTPVVSVPKTPLVSTPSIPSRTEMGGPSSRREDRDGRPITTTYPGLPDGWTVTPSGKVRPPSLAPSGTVPPLTASDSLSTSESTITSASPSPTSNSPPPTPTAHSPSTITVSPIPSSSSTRGDTSVSHTTTKSDKSGNEHETENETASVTKPPTNTITTIQSGRASSESEESSSVISLSLSGETDPEKSTTTPAPSPVGSNDRDELVNTFNSSISVSWTTSPSSPTGTGTGGVPVSTAPSDFNGAAASNFRMPVSVACAGSLAAIFAAFL